MACCKGVWFGHIQILSCFSLLNTYNSSIGFNFFLVFILEIAVDG